MDALSSQRKCNGGSKAGYQPAYAGEQARARRWTGSRLARDEVLREAVPGRLAGGWLPEQIAGRLALDAGARVISHESIYRVVHAQYALAKTATP